MLLIWTLLLGGQMKTLAQVPVQWDKLNLVKCEDSLLYKTKKLTNNALKYVLNNEIAKLETEASGLFDFNGNKEHSIRPPAQTVMALGIALSIDMYDEKTVGIPRSEAIQIQIKLIRTL